MTEIETLSPQKRATILAGAAEVFAEDGYEGASMSRIADRARVSKGTLYTHFESKAELFAAHVETECGRRLAHIFDTSEAGEEPGPILRGIGRRMLEMMISPDGLTVYRMVIAESGKFPDLAEAFYAAGPARAVRHMSDRLAALTRAGRLRVPDPDFAAEQFFALCQTKICLRRMLRLQQPPDEAAVTRVVDAAVTMFLNTYRA